MTTLCAQDLPASERIRDALSATCQRLQLGRLQTDAVIDMAISAHSMAGVSVAVAVYEGLSLAEDLARAEP